MTISKIKYIILFFATLNFYTLAVAQSGYEDCSFLCKKIPPMNKSLLEHGLFTEQELNPNSIRVLSWNTYKGRMDGYDRDFADFASKVDIFLMQEAALNDQSVNAFNKAPYMGWEMAISFLMKKDVPSGVSNGSRVPASVKIHQRTVDKEPFVKSYKMNMITTYKIADSDKTLMTINIHGINQTPTDTLKRQLEQAAVVFSKHDGPVIFAGDFNTRNDDRTNMTEQFFKKNGFTRVIWPKDKRKKKLDHTYIKGLIINSAKLYEDVTSSDHPAMYLDVRLP